MALLHSDHMTKKEIRTYILFDIEGAKMKGGLDHYLSNKDIRHIRNSLRNLGRPHEEFCGWKFDLVGSSHIDVEIWKRFFPNQFFTDEEKKEIEDEMWQHCTPSQYDCTGQRFTHFINFFEVPNGTWIYHRLGYDY